MLPPLWVACSLTALVDQRQGGSLMSLTVALGQVGYAVGRALAGPLYIRAGYRSNRPAP